MQIVRCFLFACAAVAIVASKAGGVDSDAEELPTCKAFHGIRFDSGPSRQLSGRLDICDKYKSNTCCNSTHVEKLKIQVLETRAGNFNDQCRRISEEMTCAACHPHVGTKSITKVCPDLCDQWFRACREEYYSTSPSGDLTPCYGSALICSPLHLIVDSPAAMCSRMGYELAEHDDQPGTDCFNAEVPREKGAAEPVEPFFERMKRIFEEQNTDPSEVYSMAAFAVVVLVLVCLAVWRERHSLFCSSTKLTMEEVRRFQQENYDNSSQEFSGDGSLTAVDGISSDSSDSDSDSDEETNQKAQINETTGTQENIIQE